MRTRRRGNLCRCVYPSQPCGGTAPVCGGTCPSGERCWPIDDGSTNACQCAPDDAPPCGTSGMACDGACPAGLECQLLPGGGLFEPACGCVEPSAVCGAPGFRTCPHPDLQCVFLPGAGHQCVPTTCGNGFECTDDGTCGSGRECVPVEIAGSELCVCATPGGGCDGHACEGFSCSNGGVCRVDASGDTPTCSCTD